MSFKRLRGLSLTVCSAWRRGWRRAEVWSRARPRLAAWIWADDSGSDGNAEQSYREFNHRYFAGFGEQERMLADGPRMDFYHTLVERHVHRGDVVIDLGTGTGILAAFAAWRGAARVYAIDHSSVLDHARALALQNGLERVEFIATHSREFTLPEPKRVDVILHEQMGDFLFDEAMVANVLDLRDRLLKPGGRILPNGFEFFCEPIRVRDERRVPFLWELSIKGYDYACLERDRPQEPGYYNRIGGDSGLVDCFLGEPEPALAFDLNTLRADDLPERLVIRRRVTRAGRLDGFAVYFRTRVIGPAGLDRDRLADGETEPVLSSSPLDPGRAPHWGFRILRVEAEDFSVGETIELTFTVEAWASPDTWRWHHVRTAEPGA